MIDPPKSFGVMHQASARTVRQSSAKSRSLPTRDLRPLRTVPARTHVRIPTAVRLLPRHRLTLQPLDDERFDALAVTYDVRLGGSARTVMLGLPTIQYLTILTLPGGSPSPLPLPLGH